MTEKDADLRTVELERRSKGRFTATNARGGALHFGMGEDEEFTPVELLLAAIAGCSAIDVDLITAKRAEAESFTMTSSGQKIRDEHGNRIESADITFRVRFPLGPDGDAARDALPLAVQRSHDRICTVTRTVETGAPVTPHIE